MRWCWEFVAGGGWLIAYVVAFWSLLLAALAWTVVRLRRRRKNRRQSKPVISVHRGGFES